MLKLNFFPILIIVIAFVVNYSQQDNEQLYQIKCNGCQATKPMQNFDLNRFINPGKWYLLQVYNFGEAQRNLDCSTDNFVQNGTNVEYTGLYAYNNGSVLAIPNRFPVDQFKSGEVQYSGVDLQVIDTDYNNYAIWHACYYSSSPSSTYERVVTATRNLVVKAKYVAYMNNVIANRLGLDPSLMPLMNRTLCQYI